MISLHKSTPPPASLARQAAAARSLLEQAYDAAPVQCQQPGAPALKAKRRIYAASAVKKRLHQDQHGKCAYCEERINLKVGDVEHYRPKAGYQPAATASVQGPGYYWLAYEWENLLFACTECNRVYKRQHFPLRRETDRVRTHHAQAQLPHEAPLLLLPVRNPTVPNHLTFREEAAIGLTTEGQTTIELCQLNRLELVGKRRDRLRCVRQLELLARLLETDLSLDYWEKLLQAYGSEENLSREIAQARLDYQAAARDPAEFAGMVRANFPLLPQH